MRPFNVYVETSADEAEAKVQESIDAVLPPDGDHGQAETLAKELGGACVDLIQSRALGDNVTRYAVNVGAASTDSSDTPDSVLDVVQLNVRALSRGDLPGASEAPVQV